MPIKCKHGTILYGRGCLNCQREQQIMVTIPLPVAEESISCMENVRDNRCCYAGEIAEMNVFIETVQKAVDQAKAAAPNPTTKEA